MGIVGMQTGFFPRLAVPRHHRTHPSGTPLTPHSGLVAHGDIPLELVAHDNPLLQQKMKPRHLQMIAVGGSIGTGLFVSISPLPTAPAEEAPAPSTPSSVLVASQPPVFLALTEIHYGHHACATCRTSTQC